MISHITYPEVISSVNRAPGIPQDPLGRNYKIEKISYVRNHVIFHLKPVPSKNIEKWRSYILNERNFEKKNRKWEIPYLDTNFQKNYILNLEISS